jgi:hypothetical protein
MLSETGIMDCENVPPEMVAQFDRPWNFVKEVPQWECHSLLEVLCKCQTNHLSKKLKESPATEMVQPLIITSCKAYEFVTEDMLIVTIYFGVCEGCGAVYWARQGPPYRMLSSFVPVG